TTCPAFTPKRTPALSLAAFVVAATCVLSVVHRTRSAVCSSPHRTGAGAPSHSIYTGPPSFLRCTMVLTIRNSDVTDLTPQEGDGPASRHDNGNVTVAPATQTFRPGHVASTPPGAERRESRDVTQRSRTSDQRPAQPGSGHRPGRDQRVAGVPRWSDRRPWRTPRAVHPAEHAQARPRAPGGRALGDD